MWSHSINDGSIGGGESDTPQDSFCRSCDKASSDDDVRLMFNLSAVYQLPFGAGKPYLGSPGIARAVFGGWELSAIGTTQSGLPVNITIDRSNASVPGLYSIGGEERPDYIYGVSLTPARGIRSTRIGSIKLRFPRPPHRRSGVWGEMRFGRRESHNWTWGFRSMCLLQSA